MSRWYAHVLALIAMCMIATGALAQSSVLPLSKTALGAAAEVRRELPEWLQPAEIPMLDSLSEGDLGLSEVWRTRCGRDELTGETTSCWLDSPNYMPVNWEAHSSCRTHRQLLEAAAESESVVEPLVLCITATFSDAIFKSQRLTVHCDGRVQTGLLFMASRFMVGENVVTHEVGSSSDSIDDPRTLFRSSDGSWTDTSPFAFEGARSNETARQVFRFVPDGPAVREFLAGPHCATEQ